MDFTHMAGRPVAHLDHIPAFGLKGEVLVEGGHAINLRRADPQFFRQVRERLAREVAVLSLSILQNRDDAARLIPIIS